RRPRHRLHAGVGDRGEPLPRPHAGGCLRGGNRLRARRTCTRLRARTRGRAGPRSFRCATPVMDTAETGGVRAHELPLAATDGHRYTLLARIPERADRSLLWLPALGVAARHYLPFADALAARGVAVFLHEWRGNGSSALRPDRDHDWGYRELLTADLPASEQAIDSLLPGLPRVIGGHSLGGQLACCHLALAPD